MADSSLPGMLLQSLSRFWSSCETLDDDEVAALFAAFVAICVQPSFQAKFRTEFNRKPITQRFFKKHELIDADSSLAHPSLFPAASEVAGQVLWSLQGSLFGLRFSGKPTTLDRIFVEEGDAIARLQSGSRCFYLFLSGPTGRLYLIPGDSPRRENVAAA